MDIVVSTNHRPSRPSALDHVLEVGVEHGIPRVLPQAFGTLRARHMHLAPEMWAWEPMRWGDFQLPVHDPPV